MVNRWTHERNYILVYMKSTCMDAYIMLFNNLVTSHSSIWKLASKGKWWCFTYSIIKILIDGQIKFMLIYVIKYAKRLIQLLVKSSRSRNKKYGCLDDGDHLDVTFMKVAIILYIISIKSLQFMVLHFKWLILNRLK